jgi:hypothetical protein
MRLRQILIGSLDLSGDKTKMKSHCVSFR